MLNIHLFIFLIDSVQNQKSTSTLIYDKDLVCYRKKNIYITKIVFTLSKQFLCPFPKICVNLTNH